MDPATFKRTLTVMALMALAAAGIALMPELQVPASAGVAPRLPAAVGDRKAKDLLYCQEEKCMKSFAAEAVGTSRVCPACGGALAELTLGERQMLPPDTVVLRKEYVGPAGDSVTASVVLSGREQKSIHRPQQCLPGQGYVIESSREISVYMEERAPLRVMLLELRRPVRTADGGRENARVLFAYWFKSGDRETPSHVRRLLLMSTDRLFRKTVSRWAYIAVFMGLSGDKDEGVARIESFIREFYPLITESESQS